MMSGRFFFGVGTGENLNEHVLGVRWPPHDIRRAMFEEAVEVIRMLWQGETQRFWDDYYTVEDARLFTLPDELPSIMVAAEGSSSADVAGRLGDGLIAVGPQEEIVKGFQQAGGEGRPYTVCHERIYAPLESLVEHARLTKCALCMKSLVEEKFTSDSIYRPIQYGN